MKITSRAIKELGLLEQVTCPHCWNKFPPFEIRWISAHPELRDDPKVGSDALKRFLPSRFNHAGQAIDVNGVACSELACPDCHLQIPRALTEMSPLFFSILGAPGSGKSFYLASMIWQMRRTLNSSFHLSFSDADPAANQILNNYEETLFLAADPEKIATLPKTEKEGDLYQGVRVEERTVWYPKPFVFTIQPNKNHPLGDKTKQMARSMCLYDNAGEHFLPGGETANSPGTQHLGLSDTLLFLFDPTQHPNLTKALGHKTPQKKEADPNEEKDWEDINSWELVDDIQEAPSWTSRQDQILFEAASRIRSQTGLSQNEKYEKPFVVIVTKYDVWHQLIKNNKYSTSKFLKKTKEGLHVLDITQINELSEQVYQMLSQHTPEFISAVESFAANPVFLPVSALGSKPEKTISGGYMGIRPSKIKPLLVEIPMLYALQSSTRGFVSGMKFNQK